MKKWGILLISLVFILTGSNAMAIGLGPYFNVGFGDITLSEFFANDEDIDFDSTRFAFGFLLDTCTSADSVFNYRLNIGYYGVDYESEDYSSLPGDQKYEGDGGGFDMKHTFGFGVVRNQAIRLWLGPSIKFYADFVDEDTGDVANIGIGAGPEIGINIHMGGGFSLGLSSGVMFNYVASAWEGRYGWLDDETYSGMEILYFFQIAPIFNLGGDRDAWTSVE